MEKEAFCSYLTMALIAWGDEPRKSQPYGPASELFEATHTFLPALLSCACLAHVDVAWLRGPFPVVSLASPLSSCMLSIFLIHSLTTSSKIVLLF